MPLVIFPAGAIARFRIPIWKVCDSWQRSVFFFFLVDLSMGILSWEHLLKFVFETVTDVAFVPSLAVVAERQRHFELFVGVSQFVTSLCFNMTDALDVDLFLSARQWHELTNIFTITYGLHLCIYLMGNRHESRDTLLRYLAFALVWITQIKDRYWMENTRYTVYVVGLFVLLMILKLVADPRNPAYQTGKVLKGVFALVIAALFFYLSLDDPIDPYRLFHGLAQVCLCVFLYDRVRVFLYDRVRVFLYDRVRVFLCDRMRVFLCDRVCILVCVLLSVRVSVCFSLSLPSPFLPPSLSLSL